MACGISAELVSGALVAARSETIADLIRNVIAPLGYYSEEARRAEIAKYTAGNIARMANEDPASVLAAIVDSTPVGFCISEIDDGLIWLSWIGVHPRFRQQGIAELLLEALEQTAPQRRCHKVWCDCRTTNEPSRRLLARVGYRQFATVTNHWYKHDYFLWEKELTMP